MANYTDCSFMFRAENLFELAKLTEIMANSDMKGEVADREVNTEELTANYTIFGRWSVHLPLFEEVAKQAMYAAFYEAEQANDFYRSFEWEDNEMVYQEGAYFSKEHMHYLDDVEFFEEELRSIAEGYSQSEFREAYASEVSNFCEVYDRDIDKTMDELLK